MVIHVTEVTQPQGHSTSGSHERYKSEDRLRWEADFDGLEKFKEWILNYSIELEGKEEILATVEELENIEKEAKKIAKDGQKKAWENYRNSIEVIKNEVLPLVKNLKSQNSEVEAELQKFGSLISYAKKDVFSLMRKVLQEQNLFLW